MSEKTDQKLESVVLARYTYRHEAEFAAGFLDDADIPYRLQLDDPAMGMTVGTPATIWVLGMDLRRAREILDLPERAWPAGGAAELPEEVGEAMPVSARPSPAPAGGIVRRGAAGEVVRSGAPGEVDRARLDGVERAIALVGCGASVGAAFLVQAAPLATLWTALLGAAALVTGAAGLLGRTVPALRDLLRSISGSAR